MRVLIVYKPVWIETHEFLLIFLCPLDLPCSH